MQISKSKSKKQKQRQLEKSGPIGHAPMPQHGVSVLFSCNFPLKPCNRMEMEGALYLFGLCCNISHVHGSIPYFVKNVALPCPHVLKLKRKQGIQRGRVQNSGTMALCRCVIERLFDVSVGSSPSCCIPSHCPALSEEKVAEAKKNKGKKESRIEGGVGNKQKTATAIWPSSPLSSSGLIFALHPSPLFVCLWSVCIQDMRGFACQLFISSIAILSFSFIPVLPSFSFLFSSFHHFALPLPLSFPSVFLFTTPPSPPFPTSRSPLPPSSSLSLSALNLIHTMWGQTSRATEQQPQRQPFPSRTGHPLSILTNVTTILLSSTSVTTTVQAQAPIPVCCMAYSSIEGMLFIQGGLSATGTTRTKVNQFMGLDLTLNTWSTSNPPWRYFLNTQHPDIQHTLPPSSSHHSMTTARDQENLFVWDPTQEYPWYTYELKRSYWNRFQLNNITVTQKPGIRNGVDPNTSFVYFPAGNNNGLGMFSNEPGKSPLYYSDMPVDLMPEPVIHESFVWSSYQKGFLHYGGRTISGNKANPYLHVFRPPYIWGRMVSLPFHPFHLPCLLICFLFFLLAIMC